MVVAGDYTVSQQCGWTGIRRASPGSWRCWPSAVWKVGVH